jgi:nucleoside-diphosphate-sugar epimerase
MTRTRVPPVLVTGATGRVGRAVINLLVEAGVPVRALARRPEAAATLPANVEVVTGDLTVPGSLDAGLRVPVPSSSSGPPRRRLLRQSSRRSF